MKANEEMLLTSISIGKKQKKKLWQMKKLSQHLTVKERNKMKNEGQMKNPSGHLTVQEGNKLKN